MGVSPPPSPWETQVCGFQGLFRMDQPINSQEVTELGTE